MTADEPKQEIQSPEEAVFQHTLEELAQVQERIGPFFHRSEA